MPNCYRCGTYFKAGDFQLRRKVRTGEHLTNQYRSGKVNVVSIRYGPRVVCKSCAKQIDRENKRAEIAPYFGLLLLLGILLAVFIVQLVPNEVNKPPTITSEVQDGVSGQLP